MQASTTMAAQGAPFSRSLGSRQRRALFAHPLWWIGLGILTALAVLSFVGPLFYHVNPLAVHPSISDAPPSAHHLFGTDVLGRDELARVMWGGQGFMLVGFASALVASVLGTGVGLLAGFSGGIADRILMRVADIFLGIPQLVPLLLFDVIFQPNDFTMIVILALTSWPLVSRLVRAEVLAVRAQDYVEAAVAAGASRSRVLRRHVLPNILSTALVSASGQLGQTVLILATASYLGFGLPPPNPNWASMVASSTQYLTGGNWWLFLAPGLAFMILQVAVYFVADACREAFNPRALQGGH
jgi:peptide/nickel transport system permease protein